MKRILGVLEHGNADGFPFTDCFDGIENIRTVKDFRATNVSAVLYWGGTDVSPSLYGERPNSFNQAGHNPSARDLIEWTLMNECKRFGIPMIGVCRGAQLLCVFAGGKLAQDVSGHLSSHYITDGSERYYAAADHHQMMLPANTDHKLIAWADPYRAAWYTDQNDSMVYFEQTFKEPEIVWFPEIKGLAIQPHPEWMPEEADFVKYVKRLVKEYIQ